MCEAVEAVMKRQFRMAISNVFIQKPHDWQSGWNWESDSTSVKKYLTNMLAKPATETYSEPAEPSLYLHIQQILLIYPSALHLDTEGMM